MDNTVLLDISRNMLIKFSKHIGNNLAKIINTNVNSRPCQTSETELKSLLGSKENSESCQLSKMELFVKIVKKDNLFTIFVKNFAFYV